MHKTLTLVIPSYNMEAYLPRCIEGLGIDRLKEVCCHEEESLADRLEVLIVNDGSTDKTSAIAHEFEVKYTGVVRVIDKQNGHYGSCINRGLAEATGTFIKILDADDTFETGAFHAYMHFLTETCEDGDDGEVDLVLTDFQKINFDGTPFEERFSFRCSTDDAFTVDNLSHWDTCLMPAVTYRTDRLRRMNYVQTEGVLYSDVEWSVTPLCVVRQVRYFPVRLYLYSMGRAGQSMDAAVYHAHLADLVAVKKDLVVQIAGWNEYARDDNKIFVRDVVQKSLQSLYLLFFLNYGTAEANRFLRKFDDEMKTLDGDMHARLRALTLPSKNGFHYIRFWQDHKWADWLVRRYVHCYSPLALILGKCLRRK